MITLLKNLFAKNELSGRTSNEIVEEIHDTFYTEVDRLLDTAQQSNSLETNKQDLIDKRNRLVALGFTKTQEVEEANREIHRLGVLKNKNIEKETLIRAINHFAFKYPNYKFITEESVKKICEKYGLVYDIIGNYIGTVPDENLKHIENFSVKIEDVCCENIDYRRVKIPNYYCNWANYNYIEECPLEIVAPQKDFNMTNKVVKDFKIFDVPVKDPIVLKPVFFERQKHYLIVTAWGLEGSDEMVVNQRFN